MKAQGILGQCILFVGSAVLVTAGIQDACAQTQSPLTGKLSREPAAAMANTSAPVVQPATVVASSASSANTAARVPTPETPAATEQEAAVRIGDVTRTLLQAQADGRVAGPRLPMLGATADASWQRYLDSFKHPLPEFYEIKTSKSNPN